MTPEKVGLYNGSHVYVVVDEWDQVPPGVFANLRDALDYVAAENSENNLSIFRYSVVKPTKNKPVTLPAIYELNTDTTQFEIL